ncbi:hypothetical protein HKX48_002301 [Thoreauomyces humboldtii]|nr:hypothetical protein HKX48_002301 [Thoreauomyces humboldtii]
MFSNPVDKYYHHSFASLPDYQPSVPNPTSSVVPFHFQSTSSIPASSTLMSGHVSADLTDLTSLMVLYIWHSLPLPAIFEPFAESTAIIPLVPRSCRSRQGSLNNIKSDSDTNEYGQGSTQQHPPLTSTIITDVRLHVEELLTSTLVSSQVIVLALKYLERISQARHLLPAASPFLVPSHEGYLLAFLVSLVLANKYSDDERFTNDAWAGVAGLNVQALNAAERQALRIMDWRLGVAEEEYSSWIEKLRIISDTAAINVVAWEQEMAVGNVDAAEEPTGSHHHLGLSEPAWSSVLNGGEEEEEEESASDQSSHSEEEEEEESGPQEAPEDEDEGDKADEEEEDIGSSTSSSEPDHDSRFYFSRPPPPCIAAAATTTSPQASTSFLPPAIQFPFQSQPWSLLFRQHVPAAPFTHGESNYSWGNLAYKPTLHQPYPSQLNPSYPHQNRYASPAMWMDQQPTGPAVLPMPGDGLYANDVSDRDLEPLTCTNMVMGH